MTNSSAVKIFRATEGNLTKRASEKSLYVYSFEIRTANRHRWSRREDEGERVKVLQGTRQKISRNLGIRLASAKHWHADFTRTRCGLHADIED